MRKIRNLTRSPTRNDPINFLIKGFSSRDFENEFRLSRGDFFQFSSPNLDFKYSSNTEMSLEEVESSDSKTELSKQFDFLETSKNEFFRRRTCQFIEEFGNDRWMCLFIFDQRLRLNVIKLRSVDRR